LIRDDGLNESSFDTSQPLVRLEGYWFITSDSQDVVILMGFEPVAQIQIASIDRISDDPIDGNGSSFNTLHHLNSEFWFCLETNRIWDVGSVPTIGVLAPVQRQVQFPVNERVALGRHI